MEVVVYTCQIISPMFIHGADTNYLELSSAAFKSSMRFWWRILQKENGMKLLEKEEELFGGVTTEYSLETSKFVKSLKEKDGDDKIPLKKYKGRRSPVDIWVKPITKLKYEKTPLVAHKEFGKRAFVKDELFQVTLLIRRGSNLQFYENLFELASILGGVGQRSRRGMGSYQIVKKEYPLLNQECEIFTGDNTLSEEVWKRIKSISSFEISQSDDGSVKVIHPESHIEELKLFDLKIFQTNKSDSEEICRIVSQSTHDIRANNMRKVRQGDLQRINYKDFERCLGGIKPRQASPVYVSQAKHKDEANLYIIVVFLTIDYEKISSIPENKVENVYQIQKIFYNLICRGLNA